ncbi:FHA domain-containing protein [bacterium]|nr:FHA domain-containing protein [bacterium]
MDSEKLISCIEVIRGPDQTKVFLLNKPVSIIGRSWYCDISLNDASASRQHAQLSFDEGPQGDLFLKDLNSSNGVFLNKERVSYAKVALGDEILVGRSVLHYHRLTREELANSGCQVQREDIEYIPSKGKLLATVNVDQEIPDQVRSSDQQSVEKIVRSMLRLSEVLAGPDRIEQKMDTVLSIVFDEVKAESGVILIRDPANDRLELKAFKHKSEDSQASPYKVSWTIIERCMQERIGILANDAQVDPRFDKAESIVQGKFRSVIALPLILRDTIQGVIFLSTSLQSGLFSSTDLDFLMGLAHQMALVIEHDQTIKAHLFREKMAEMGELISGLSYYLKNILISFSSSREIIEESLVHDHIDSVRKAWPGITEAADKIQDLVTNMLFFVSGPMATQEKVDLNQIILEMLTLYKPVIDQRKIELVTELSDKLPACSFDRVSLARAFRNIFQNALEAIWDSEKPAIKISTHWLDKKKQLELKIHDNGYGIAPENFDRIFHYLFSTKGDAGTGLGLYIAKQIIAQHQGSISVFSTPDQGCEMTITLPAS